LITAGDSLSKFLLCQGKLLVFKIVYINRYPDNPDSKDLLFENARYYLKLDDLNNANKIYDEFAVRYPDDPRTIEAYFRRGEYYFENQQFALAKQEFRKAISRSDQFARTGRDPNLLYASSSRLLFPILNRILGLNFSKNRIN
jgi:tetratricopeptide (TPR) repeat protein